MFLYNFVAFFAFYAATWEEYNTGTLYLGYVSGPIEGQIILVFLFLLAPLLGNNFWNSTLFSIKNIAFKYNDSMVMFVMLGSLMTTMISITNVYAKMGFSTLYQLLPYSLYSALVTATFYLVEEFHRDDFNACNLLYLATWGLGFTCAVLRIISAYVCIMPYPFWTLSYLPVMVIAGWAANRRYYLVPAISQIPLLYVLVGGLTFNTIVYGNLVFNTVRQFCGHLGISCFTIKPPVKKKEA